jgi:lipoprotein-anchoring transpeptidase ErfK/SrfK
MNDDLVGATGWSDETGRGRRRFRRAWPLGAILLVIVVTGTAVELGWGAPQTTFTKAPATAPVNPLTTMVRTRPTVTAPVTSATTVAPAQATTPARATTQSTAAAQSSAAAPHYLDVDVSKQLLTEYRDGKVIASIHVSTGSESYYWQDGTRQKAHTPRGHFQVQRKLVGWVHEPLGDLYYPLYFTGGFAVHGSGSVPAHPASHGCVRVALDTAVVVHPDTRRNTGLRPRMRSQARGVPSPEADVGGPSADDLPSLA